MTGSYEWTPRIEVYILRSQVSEDRRAVVRYYRHGAGAAGAEKLVKAMAQAEEELSRNSSIGAPNLG